MTVTPVERVEIRSGAYADSVTLMQISRTLGEVVGVSAAQVAMGTDLNLDVLRGMGFDLPDGVGANDLIVAIRAESDDAVAAADETLAAALAPKKGGSGGSGGAHVDLAAPTTASAAVQREGTLALISLPGQHAFTEAFDALSAGLDVMLFSDNVTVAQEIRLKDEAAGRGLLVMGPDCGTAVVGGVGLGFANVVAPGPVGIVAASGTGAQQVLTLLDGAGVGVRHCLGVGGRDLSSAVGGRSTRQALRLLDEDPSVELIVLVSKPPAPEVAAEIDALLPSLGTAVVKALLGTGQGDLTQAVARAVEALGGAWQAPRSWAPAGAGTDPGPGAVTGAVRGAFSGGTLCDEAMQIAAAFVGPIASNIPLAGAPAVGGDLTADGHVMIDFGDDDLTRGRPHPMIDTSIRIDWILKQAADPATGTLLLDVVLGHGSHADPAADLAPALAQARATAAAQGRDLRIVVSLCGSAGDPQGLDRQAEALAAAGAAVYASNAAAARAAFGIGDPQ